MNESKENPGQLPLSESAATAKGIRILVADDNEDAARSLGMLLQFEGHEVETVFDGLEAVARVAEFLPDLVILDIGMPGLDGHDAAREIRRQCSHSMRLVALTGRGLESDRQSSINAGFDAHFLKPLEFSTLTKFLSAPASEAPRQTQF